MSEPFERKTDRMKKALCLGLAMLLLLSATAGLADGVIPNLRETPTVTPAGGAFSFRGGVQWNMSREQVRLLELVELTERNQDEWSILYPLNPVQVSKFNADLVYMFFGDRLKMISYDFGASGTEADFQYLTGALDSVYGDHTEPDASDIIGIMDQIYPGYYTAERLTNRRGWKAGDDTLIYLYYYAESSYAVLYVCAGSTQGSYVTTGL